MSFEFIIGTVIGLGGLWLTYICSKEQIIHYFRPNMKYLLDQLASGNLSSKEQKRILRKMNRMLKFYGKNISNEYIESYALNSKAKSSILQDICFANDIEPSPEICKAFLNYDSPVMRNLYQQSKKGNKQEQKNRKPDATISTPQNMRPNTVYISSLLKEKYPHAANELLSILKRHNVSVKELAGTKDVWCRDYMPIQNRKGELIQFKYDPLYLKNEKYEKTRSDVDKVCKANGITSNHKSDIILDGGNVVLFDDKAFVTDRIFKENPSYEREKLVSDLGKLLDAKIIIIKSYNSENLDFTGHADGMVRFVDEHTILCNDLDKDYKYIRESIQDACSKNGMKYENIPFFTTKYDKNNPDSSIGVYVNYLEVNDLIVLPRFNVKDNLDEEALKRFHEIFPDRIIEVVNYNEVALKGGMLNCSTWTVRE